MAGVFTVDAREQQRRKWMKDFGGEAGVMNN